MLLSLEDRVKVSTLNEGDACFRGIYGGLVPQMWLDFGLDLIPDDSFYIGSYVRRHQPCIRLKMRITRLLRHKSEPHCTSPEGLLTLDSAAT